MNERDLRSLLRAGDPAAHDETPSPGQLANMRRQVLHAARTPDVARTPWHQPLAVAAAVALTVAAGIFAAFVLRTLQPEAERLPHFATPVTVTYLQQARLVRDVLAADPNALPPTPSMSSAEVLAAASAPLSSGNSRRT